VSGLLDICASEPGARWGLGSGRSCSDRAGLSRSLQPSLWPSVLRREMRSDERDSQPRLAATIAVPIAQAVLNAATMIETICFIGRHLLVPDLGTLRRDTLSLVKRRATKTPTATANPEAQSPELKASLSS
jgi:hypothetical protein